MTENISAKVNDLESKLAFQDDLLDRLDAIVTEQEQRIKRLETAYQLLSSTVKGAGLDINTGDERPPHY